MKNKNAARTGAFNGIVTTPSTQSQQAVPKGKDIFSILSRLTYYLRNYMGPINDSKIFAGLMIITLNIGSKYVNLRLPKPIEGYLKFTFSRNILVFAISWMGTRDILVALLITGVFILVMDFLLNDESAYCCLPESFIDYHLEAMTNHDPSGNAIPQLDVSNNQHQEKLYMGKMNLDHIHDELFEEGHSGGTLGFSHYPSQYGQ